jgi:PBP1b-binding outer membrane lipoprotein LpoB
MTTKTWLKSSIFALAVILSACSGEATETEKKEATKESSEPAKVADQKEEPATEPAASIEEEGTYIGQIDNNSIEVEAAGDTLVLRLTDEVRDTVANLEDGSKVSIVYKKNENDQWILEKITAAESGTGEPAASQTLKYTVNGNPVEKEAALTESEQGYYFYKIEDFEFTAEEPRKDVMFATEFAETFVRIEPLSEDASIEDLKKWANDELEAVGEVKEVNGVETGGPAFESTELFITASKSSFKKFIVIQELESGDKMKYTINLPEHKKTAEWEQAIWAMLSTLKTK